MDVVSSFHKFHAQHVNKSHEELRLEDYKINNKGGPGSANATNNLGAPTLGSSRSERIPASDLVVVTTRVSETPTQGNTSFGGNTNTSFGNTNFGTNNNTSFGNNNTSFGNNNNSSSLGGMGTGLNTGNTMGSTSFGNNSTSFGNTSFGNTGGLTSSKKTTGLSLNTGNSLSFGSNMNNNNKSGGLNLGGSSSSLSFGGNNNSSSLSFGGNSNSGGGLNLGGGGNNSSSLSFGGSSSGLNLGGGNNSSSLSFGPTNNNNNGMNSSSLMGGNMGLGLNSNSNTTLSAGLGLGLGTGNLNNSMMSTTPQRYNTNSYTKLQYFVKNESESAVDVSSKSSSKTPNYKTIPTQLRSRVRPRPSATLFESAMITPSPRVRGLRRHFQSIVHVLRASHRSNHSISRSYGSEKEA